jgi:hypothetical protein
LLVTATSSKAIIAGENARKYGVLPALLNASNPFTPGISFNPSASIRRSRAEVFLTPIIEESIKDTRRAQFL